MYDNYTSVVMLEWFIGLIGAWLTLISIILGYFYKNCAYLHCDKSKEETERNNGNEGQSYKCESCKYTWESKDCVIKHVI